MNIEDFLASPNTMNFDQFIELFSIKNIDSDKCENVHVKKLIEKLCIYYLVPHTFSEYDKLYTNGFHNLWIKYKDNDRNVVYSQKLSIKYREIVISILFDFPTIYKKLIFDENCILLVVYFAFLFSNKNCLLEIYKTKYVRLISKYYHYIFINEIAKEINSNLDKMIENLNQMITNVIYLNDIFKDKIISKNAIDFGNFQKKTY